MAPTSLSAPAALEALLRRDSGARGLDVRSEGEFAQGSIPGFANVPILTNAERHQVGICYKQEGSAAAVALGERLVAPEKEKRIEAWARLLEGAEIPLVACWRGGMRSGYAARWLGEKGKKAVQVEGGYKALRRELLQAYQNLPSFLVVSGPTGSGKSALLREAKRPKLDLEHLAKHRGSAFGGWVDRPQPAQATFENALAFEIRKQASDSFLVEDESRLVGRVALPEGVRRGIEQGQVIRIEASVASRASRIVEEYVKEPLAEGLSAAALEAVLEASLQKISSKLGGLVYSEIRGAMRRAFAESEIALHEAWVKELLEKYYDKAYEHSFQRLGRKVVFRGDWQECLNWMQSV
jgi:tRNA 2-selenouridine synthase